MVAVTACAKRFGPFAAGGIKLHIKFSAQQNGYSIGIYIKPRLCYTFFEGIEMFGDNLKKYRIESGYSQSELAEKLYVTRQCVSKWEKGVTEPDIAMLSQISEILGVSVDALVKNDGQRPPRSNWNTGLLVANILIAVFGVVAFVIVFRFLPKTIPAHWTDGEIDRFGSRNEVFLNLIIPVPVLAADIALFFALKKMKDRRIVCIAHGVVALFQIAYLIFYIALYAKYFTDVMSFVTCLTADIILCFSIAMHPKISRQNYLLGVRTTETLNSENVWKKANVLACYLFAGCSVAIITVNMAVVFKLSFLSLLAYVVAGVIVILYIKLYCRGGRED